MEHNQQNQSQSEVCDLHQSVKLSPVSADIFEAAEQVGQPQS